ncbi:MAG TPA: gas vesicle protein GvpG [Acidimicrobiales bacterium]|nr:gas vesicle protein GvpG [Acidimicrobiales bacterium]
MSVLVTLPVSGPVRGAVWVMEQIVREAERETYGERATRRALTDLSRARRSGQIGAAEADLLEDELMTRLAEAREWEAGGRRGVAP